MTAGQEILIVEDNADVRYLAAKRLKAAGYSVLEAADGVEAMLRIIDHPNCRRMVTDYVMPSFGGEYWVKFLERFCKGWVIVIVSSEDIDPGPFICVPKPVDYENLLHVFEREPQ
jgi:CheY-like chemotaxis protein